VDFDGTAGNQTVECFVFTSINQHARMIDTPRVSCSGDMSLDRLRWRFRLCKVSGFESIRQ